jgi:hypothetical protein
LSITETTEPVPFFKDERSVSQRLSAEQRQWKPTKGEGPSLLCGLVLDRGTYISGLNGQVCKTAVVLDADGVEWSVIGFHGWLVKILERDDPRIGDWVALSFNGTKPSKTAGESDAYVYRGVVERDPDNPLPRPPADRKALEESIAGEQELARAAEERAAGDGAHDGVDPEQAWGAGDDDIPFAPSSLDNVV